MAVGAVLDVELPKLDLELATLGRQQNAFTKNVVHDSAANRRRLQAFVRLLAPFVFPLYIGRR